VLLADTHEVSSHEAVEKSCAVKFLLYLHRTFKDILRPECYIDGVILALFIYYYVFAYVV